MKYILTLLVFIPSCAFAHAVPTAYTPDHGAVLAASPSEVAITFSDRIDPANSTITLYAGGGGPLFLPPRTSPKDPRTLYVSVPQISGGTTLVWGVTSLDDGHYTHGAFNFSVGEMISTPPHGKFGHEQQIIALLFAASCILLVLRVASYLYLERIPRCALCVRSYALSELLTGVLVATLLALSLFLPSAYWEKETTEDGITIRLSGGARSSMMTLSVSGAEKLPDPLFEIGNREASVDPMPIALTPLSRSDSTTAYTFPSSVFTPHGNWHVSTTFVRGDHYDAHGAMNFVYPDDLTKTKRRWEHASLGGILHALFALTLLCLLAIRLIAVLRGGAMWMEIPPRVSAFVAYGTAVFAFLIFLVSLALLATLY